MLSQILALIIAIVLFSALLQGKYPRYLLTLAAGGAMVLVVLLGTMGSPAAALEAPGSALRRFYTEKRALCYAMHIVPP